MKYEYSRFPNKNPNKPWFSRPMVNIELFGPTDSILTHAVVDSGADNCLFNMQFAKKIGVDLNKCEKSKTFGIAGQIMDVYVSNDVEIQIESLDKTKIPIGFIDSPSVNGLLGQKGFFDSYRVKFEKDHNIFEITAVKRK